MRQDHESPCYVHCCDNLLPARLCHWSIQQDVHATSGIERGLVATSLHLVQLKRLFRPSAVPIRSIDFEPGKLKEIFCLPKCLLAGGKGCFPGGLTRRISSPTLCFVMIVLKFSRLCSGWQQSLTKRELQSSHFERRRWASGFMAKKMSATALVSVVMGSASDWETMRHCVELLDRFRCA